MVRRLGDVRRVAKLRGCREELTWEQIHLWFNVGDFAGKLA